MENLDIQTIVEIYSNIYKITHMGSCSSISIDSFIYHSMFSLFVFLTMSCFKGLISGLVP